VENIAFALRPKLSKFGNMTGYITKIGNDVSPRTEADNPIWGWSRQEIGL
jgi:hypothetical protein